jgi:hypothetical protein
MFSRTTTLLIAATALLLSACSGGVDLPPPPEQVDNALSTDDGGADPHATCHEGSSEKCIAPVGFENGGYVACAAGKKTCHRGEWSTCSTRVTFASAPGWEPADVGCTWPPQACGVEDAMRTCRKQLPPTEYTARCTDVTEVCFGGVWRACGDL